MLGLVGAQLNHKIENKQIKAGKAVWVDVSARCDYCHCYNSVLIPFRLVVAPGKLSEPIMISKLTRQDTTLKQWRHSFQ
jgi:hypothetical protein